ncbi:polyamine aminopropyltransferase [bacterium]|nr:polyamine aminopropyltransferase [bacterium]
MSDQDWIVETSEHYKTSFKVKKRLFCGQSDFQKVEVVDTELFGKMLFNDDLAMVSDRDEFVYHEMISHVPLFTHPNPRRVLIIGGGDGGTAREVCRHSRVEKCMMVEIDKMVVDACKEHIPSCSWDLANPKLEVLIDDGIKFVKETSEKFDLILVDSTDPIGPAEPLFGTEFYCDIYNCLSDDGIVVSQCENPWNEMAMQKKLVSILAGLFPIVNMYNYHNLTYPSGTWSFSIGSKKLCPKGDFQTIMYESEKLKCKYYNSEVHLGAFALPEFQKREIIDFLK